MSLTMTDMSKIRLMDNKSNKSKSDNATNKTNTSRRIKIDSKKYYLHRYASQVNKPLYDVFICYGNDEFFECNDDDVHLNFNAMLEERQELESGQEMPRPRTGD